jgi:hypothetical protein
VLQLGAEGYDALHEATGLPWWATIATASVALRLLLLPLSLRQAKIIRTNYGIWREAKALTEQQQERAAAAAAAKLQLQPGSTAALSGLNSSSGGSSTSSGGGGGSSSPAGSSGAGSGASSGASGGQQAPPSASSRLQQQLAEMQAFQARVDTFHVLRRKAGAPHPAWIIINPLLQARHSEQDSVC